jgi:sec-independent protein translocase protein TatB
MFGLGWSELLIIAIVAMVVVGPRDLPRLMRSFGHYTGKLRRMAGDFQIQFEEAMREAETEEVATALQSVRDAVPPLSLSALTDRPVMLPKPGRGVAVPEPLLTAKAKGTKAYAPGAKHRKMAVPETQIRVSKAPRARKGKAV